MNLGATLGNLVWQLTSWPEYCRYLGGLHSLKSTQEKLLSEALSRSAGSVYGRRHSVNSCWDYSVFRQAVPVCQYEDLLWALPYPQALSIEEVKIWEPTGGSTGHSKWIPWTATLQSQFRRAVAVWIFDLFRQDPRLRYGRSYWQLTPKSKLTPPAWLEDHRVGFESDGDYLGATGKLLESVVLVPGPTDQENFWGATVTHLSQAKDLRLLSCWSPSFLLVLKEKFGDIMGTWEPQRWWPNLHVISCWTQGPSTLLADQVRECFGQAKIQPKGLLSTEAVTTIPLREQHPLAYRSHFFEFQDASGNIFASWEIQKGGPYRVIQTTGGGLLRYDSGDLVEVTGFLGQVPCLKFLARDGVSDHFGEKLSLEFLTTLLKSLGGFARIAFEKNSYVLYLDEGRKPESRAICYRRVRESLDAVYSYRDCRQIGQLSELRLFLLKGHGHEQLLELLRDNFALRKPAALLPPGIWSERFTGKFLPVESEK